MRAEPPRSPKAFRRSLRTRVTLGIALPLVLVLASGALVHYWHSHRMLDEQIELTALQLGDMMLGSLQHAMLSNNPELLTQIVTDVGRMDAVHRVVIVDVEGRVKVDSLGEQQAATLSGDELGCVECHRVPGETLPRVANLTTPAGLLRVSTPIGSEAACTKCHAQEDPHLAMLLVDVSILDFRDHLLSDLRTELAIFGVGAVLVALGLQMLVHRLVVRRVEAFGHPLTEFAAGDFSSRLPSSTPPTDELDEFAVVFNQMAEKLQHQVMRQEERAQVRQRAIIEERERIARELHDGMAQVLGYVSTKAMAARLKLKTGQSEAADAYLVQLEQATRGLFVDVRQAVLGLRAAGDIGGCLGATLQDFAVQFSQLSDIPVEVLIAPEAEDLDLPAETELQLLRIMQEALTNVRKHASATKGAVSLQVIDGALTLTISDDGIGFDSDNSRTKIQQQFGLSTMQERAEAINAEFKLESAPGAGTHIAVRLPT